ncbi:MAG: potassium transporter Kup [Beijerinckiaceae bacterium]|nr:potassium transporter Kup [Beijerinckiaceae bacterium]
MASPIPTLKAALQPDVASRPSDVDKQADHDPSHQKGSTLALAIGSIGVVYGDIGTSPIYALKASLAEVMKGTGHTYIEREEVISTVSLIIWALLVIVTLKYVVFIMRADNKGEGGILSLMALVQKAAGRQTPLVFVCGAIGASLFYGDSVITPAVSVLSAIEGLKNVEALRAAIDIDTYILPIAVTILVLLFVFQYRGTGRVAWIFAPVMMLWFAVIGILGVMHISDDPSILAALNPVHAFRYVTTSGFVGLLVLGSVFLAVTGAEALYADMGHFGRRPIRAAWIFFVFPALVLNYLGQGSLVLSHPEAASDPFYRMVPETFLLPLVVLAALATVIASQAVITGAFSLTQQAIQLGLLPRLEIRHTSETQLGQIYLPLINRLILVGVLILIFTFKTSDNLAAAYGIAVSGTMVVTTALAYLASRHIWKWPLWVSLLVAGSFLVIDISFITANLLKIIDGGYVPLLFGLTMVIVMWTWVRGSDIVKEKARKDSVPLTDLMRMLEKSKPARVAGTAVFLTADPDTAPTALMHNLKHNKVLHKRNIVLTIRSADVPRIDEADQLKIEELGEDIKRITATLGYMQTPRVPHILAMARRRGLDFDIMQTSFFLGRRTIKASASSGMPVWQDRLYIQLTKTAANATDFFHIPTGRVVELGSQITV